MSSTVSSTLLAFALNPLTLRLISRLLLSPYFHSFSLKRLPNIGDSVLRLELSNVKLREDVFTVKCTVPNVKLTLYGSRATLSVGEVEVDLSDLRDAIAGRSASNGDENDR